MIKVFIWMRGLSMHASLLLPGMGDQDDLYLSWMGDNSATKWRGLKIAYKNLYGAPRASHPSSSFDEDISRFGKISYCFQVHGMNETEMREWIVRIVLTDTVRIKGALEEDPRRDANNKMEYSLYKLNGIMKEYGVVRYQGPMLPYNFIKHNCCTVVANCLMENVPSSYIIPKWAQQLKVWTPFHVHAFVKKLPNAKITPPPKDYDTLYSPQEKIKKKRFPFRFPFPRKKE